MIMHVGELFAQDKWQIKPGLTLSAGVRYDLEVFPYDPKPLGDPRLTKAPIDKGNIAPRMGIVWNPDGQSKSVIRAGYGMFYDRTLLGTVDNFLTDYKYSPSFTANFPVAGPDLGPRNGTFPTDPMLQVTQLQIAEPGAAQHSQCAVSRPDRRCVTSAARSAGTIPIASSRISIRSASATSARSSRACPRRSTTCG